MKDYIAELTEGSDVVGTGTKKVRPRSAVVKTVREAILAGATNREALAVAVERYPAANMNARYVATIRSKIRAESPEVLTSHQVSDSAGLSVKGLAMAAIRGAASNAEVVERVRKAIPTSAITKGIVSTYRQEMRAAGEEVPTNWDVRPMKSTAPKKPTQKTRTVGWVAEQAIRAGATDAEALKAVRSAFPEARTTPEGIAFYRSRLRSAGEPVPKSSVVKRAKVEGMLNLAC